MSECSRRPIHAHQIYTSSFPTVTGLSHACPSWSVWPGTYTTSLDLSHFTCVLCTPLASLSLLFISTSRHPFLPRLFFSMFNLFYIYRSSYNQFNYLYIFSDYIGTMPVPFLPRTIRGVQTAPSDLNLKFRMVCINKKMREDTCHYHVL